jgi:hypothetical protein
VAQVMVIHPRCRPARARNAFSEFGHEHWLMFGEKPAVARMWERALLPDYPRLKLGTALETMHEKAAQSLSGWVAALSQRYSPHPEWWLLPLSERLGWPPGYVTDLCILEWVERRLASADGNIAVITSSRFLALSLRDLCRRRGHRIRSLGSLSFAARWVVYWMAATKRLIWAMGQYAADGFAARRVCPAGVWASKTAPSVVLATYPGESSFGCDGRFRDPYFGRLARVLADDGCQVIHLLELASIGDKRRVYEWSLSAEGRYLFFARYAGVRTHLVGLILALRYVVLLHKVGRRAWAQMDWLRPDVVYLNYVRSRAAESLRASGLAPDLLIFRWENTAREKTMMLDFRRSFPDAEIVGYLHGIPFPQSQIVNFGRTEARLLPLPDRLICCSEYVRDWLADRGIDQRILVSGPSLRHEYLSEHQEVELNGGDARTILIALPLQFEIAVELLLLVQDFWHLTTDYQIRIRPHPFHALDGLLEAAGISGTPDFVAVHSQEPMSDLLSGVRHFVYCGGTTSSCEAAALGKALYRYVSQNVISLDSLAFGFTDCRVDFTSAEELLAKLSRQHPEVRPHRAAELMEYAFSSRATDSAVASLFLGHLHERKGLPPNSA